MAEPACQVFHAGALCCRWNPMQSAWLRQQQHSMPTSSFFQRWNWTPCCTGRLVPQAGPEQRRAAGLCRHPHGRDHPTPEMYGGGALQGKCKRKAPWGRAKRAYTKAPLGRGHHITWAESRRFVLEHLSAMHEPCAPWPHATHLHWVPGTSSSSSTSPPNPVHPTPTHSTTPGRLHRCGGGRWQEPVGCQWPGHCQPEDQGSQGARG